MMKKYTIKALALCLALIFGATLQGCSPDDAVVGKVGNVNITVKQAYMYADSFLMQYNATRADITNADTLKALYKNALDAAVTYELIMQKAKETGLYPLSPSDLKSVDETVVQYADTIAQYGMSKEDFTLMLTQSKVAQLLEAQVVKDASVTDDEAKADYDKQVASQKESFTAGSGAYEAAVADGSTVVVYMPEGYRYVKHILIAMPEDVAAQITTAQNSGDTEAVKKLREQGLPQIQAKAEEVLSKVREGLDFDGLIAQYGGDPGMQQEPEKSTGYAVGENASFLQEFKDAALGLNKVGDTIGLVATDKGYHIIKYVGDVPAGPLAFEGVKDALKSQLLNTRKEDLWNAAIKQWKSETVVEQYPEKIPVRAATAAPSAS